MLTCQKEPHNKGGGYLHAEDSDAPYDVDGQLYCGRCHYSCDNATGQCENPNQMYDEGKAEPVKTTEADDLLYERINAIERLLDYWMDTFAPRPYRSPREPTRYGEVESVEADGSVSIDQIRDEEDEL